MGIDTDQPGYTSSKRGWAVSDRPHVGGSYPCNDLNTWMPDVWDGIRQRVFAKDAVTIESVIDIGCGFGYTLEWWIQRGVRCIGVEAWHDAIVQNKCREHVMIHDYTEGPFIPSQEYDLAWSAEFLEHVHMEHAPSYMATFEKCRYAAITHADVGQHGHHHVSCFDDSHWVRLFDKYGFDHVQEMTDWMRSTDTWKAPWGRRSLMFFKRRRKPVRFEKTVQNQPPPLK